MLIPVAKSAVGRSYNNCRTSFTFRLDFTPTKTGLMFYVGRWDGILYRVEQVYSVGKSGREDDDVKIQIDFLKVGKSKLPAEVRKLKDD